MMLNNDQFAIQRSLGSTLYGDVWLCEDEHHDGQLVAVKQVSLQRAKRALTINRHLDNPFEERRVASYLAQIAPRGHDNILRFRQDFLQDGSWFMVTEYCEGGDLMQRMERAPNNRLPESVALHYFRQIVRGVQFLHASGIAHRDLSLENVLLQNGVCKICDFGLAVCVPSTTSASCSSDVESPPSSPTSCCSPLSESSSSSYSSKHICRDRVGKAYYMAPEVVAQEAYDPMAADMWSLGVMLFMMLTGSPVVSSASCEEKAFLALEAFGVEKILEVWGIKSSISPAVRELLADLLQVRPEKRLDIDTVQLRRAVRRG